MADIKVAREIGAPHQVVWARLADLGSHDTWMKDAESIDFLTEQTSGVGTRMRVKTVVGPLRTIDQMEVVGWKEGESIEVVHTGLIKGRGVLEASPRGGMTTVTWEEELTFPWFLGGPVAAWLARPVLRAIWRGNLRRLEETISSL